LFSLQPLNFYCEETKSRSSHLFITVLTLIFFTITQLSWAAFHCANLHLMVFSSHLSIRSHRKSTYYHCRPHSFTCKYQLLNIIATSPIIDLIMPAPTVSLLWILLPMTFPLFPTMNWWPINNHQNGPPHTQCSTYGSNDNKLITIWWKHNYREAHLKKGKERKRTKVYCVCFLLLQAPLCYTIDMGVKRIGRDAWSMPSCTF